MRRLFAHLQPRRNLWTAIAILLVFLPVISWNVRNHPNQLAFYNSLVGRLPGTQARNFADATDYWGSSYRQGLRWLAANADPSAMVIIGVAEHVVEYAAKIWLRSDMRWMPMEGVTPDVLRDGIRAYPSNVYLMYITRETHYPELVRRCDRLQKPVYEATVNGAPVLKIQKLK